ncbi:MAG: hypothetical protein IKB45_02670 [Clostridia bacterium]|nr:hypothetical protein [Clostridia bacterium]
MKKIICWILSISVLLSLFPLSLFAEDSDFLTALRSEYVNFSDGGETVFENIEFQKTGYIYSKYEIRFSLNLDYTNPFDPEDITVNCLFMYPDGKVACIPAFYIEEMEYKKAGTTLMTYYKNNYTDLENNYWCVRFSGDTEGDYTFRLQAITSDGSEYYTTPKNFSLLHSTNNGFIEISKTNPEYFIDSSDGSLFYGSGSNIAWVRSQFTSNPEHRSYEYFLNQAASSGTNLTRVWLCHWACLEWMPKEGDTNTYSYAGLGYYNQCISSALDNIFEMCEKKGIRLILTLDDNNEHGNATDSEGLPTYDSWAYNPYNFENGGPATDTDHYWSDSEVKKHYQNRLRYIIARWGYSTSLMSLNLWNDQTTPKDETVEYLQKLNEYTKSITENYRTLLFSSNFKYDATEVLDYSTQNTANGNSGIKKPVLTQECYYSSDKNYFKSTLKNTIWNEFFSFGASAMVWSHDTVDETDSWGVLGGLLKFVNKLPLNKNTYLPHFDIRTFASTWEKDGHTPTLDIEDGRLSFTTAVAQSNATAKLEKPAFSDKANGITFRYDATELESNAAMRVHLTTTVNGETHSYMPWFGGIYYFTPDGGETQTLTVSGREQWQSFMKVNAGQSGTYHIPFDTFNIPESQISDTEISTNYKHNIYSDAGQSFAFSIQQQPTDESKPKVYVDDICWVGENYSLTAQDFSLYTATAPISAEYSDISEQSFKNITAKALGDVSDWAEKATENQFFVDENDSDLLLAGISTKLYGTNSSIAAYRNDPTFTVTCSSGGEMVIDLAAYGSGTNKLTVTNNGEQVEQVILTGGRIDEVPDEQRYVKITLNAGKNVITIANTGHDWIAISAYHFKFYMQDTADCVSVKRMISCSQQLALVKNSKSGEIYQKVFSGTPVSALNVEIPFIDLENSDYRFEICDTETGLTKHCEIITVTDNKFTAVLPEVSDILALKLTKFILGDANDSGNFDITDLVRLKKYSSAQKVEIHHDNADLDFNGVINSLDLSVLRSNLLK